MKLSLIDVLVIAAYFGFNLLLAFYYARRARGSTDEFFLSGRDAPWWLAGTSMVATTFAVDTPLAVTGIIAENGIAGNWLWWSMVMSGMMTVFFYARLWRRAGVMTDVEFSEMRYTGKPAAFLRGFRAIYLGIPVNCIILGWVNLAMLMVIRETLGLGEVAAFGVLAAMLLFTAFYTTISGLWGVMVTDVFQFILKMSMIVLLAILSVNAVGGVAELKSKVIALDATVAGGGSRLDFLPPLDSPWLPFMTLCVYLAVNWWATWYPGAEPGGGGYVAQRIFSARTERDGLLATLWFNVAHYALRTWPWIITALAALVLYPDLPNAKDGNGYIKMLMNPDVFPVSLRGVMLAAFCAAYMSTIGTQLNWGASYVINDFYRRFLVRDAQDKHYVIASQIVTVLLMIVSMLVTLQMDSISGAWKLLIVTGAGTGSVLLLRWYWWRINAWSEISAMVIAAVVSMYLQLNWKWDSGDPNEFAYLMLVTVSITTVGWLGVTFLTPPVPREKLLAFYRRVRPAGPGWRTIAVEAPEVTIAPKERPSVQFINWVLGCVIIYGVLFFIGKLIFMEWGIGFGSLAVTIVATVLLVRRLQSEQWQTDEEFPGAT